MNQQNDKKDECKYYLTILLKIFSVTWLTVV